MYNKIMREGAKASTYRAVIETVLYQGNRANASCNNRPNCYSTRLHCNNPSSVVDTLQTWSTASPNQCDTDDHKLIYLCGIITKILLTH